MPISGSHAFAVTEEQALFFGSYDEKRTLFLVDLSTLRVQKLIAMTAEGPPVKALSAIGRGHQLYLTTNDSLFMVDWQV